MNPQQESKPKPGDSIEERRAALNREMAENQALMDEIDRYLRATQMDGQREYRTIRERMEAIKDDPDHLEEFRTLALRAREIQRVTASAGEMQDRIAVGGTDDGQQSEGSDGATLRPDSNNGPA